MSMGFTVAVIGTGADRVYPARNKALAAEIADSTHSPEFLLGNTGRRRQLPRRNRLISGLARGVLVVEAAVESGR